MPLTNAHDVAGLVQSLQGLTERLSAPDLTIAEADELRPRLFLLLQRLNGPTSVPAPHIGAFAEPNHCKTERCMVV